MKHLISIQGELKAPKGQYNSFGGYKYRSAEDILDFSVSAVKTDVSTLELTYTITVKASISKIGRTFELDVNVKIFEWFAPTELTGSGFIDESNAVPTSALHINDTWIDQNVLTGYHTKVLKGVTSGTNGLKQNVLYSNWGKLRYTTNQRFKLPDGTSVNLVPRYYGGIPKLNEYGDFNQPFKAFDDLMFCFIGLHSQSKYYHKIRAFYDETTDSCTFKKYFYELDTGGEWTDVCDDEGNIIKVAGPGIWFIITGAGGRAEGPNGRAGGGGATLGAYVDLKALQEVINCKYGIVFQLGRGGNYELYTYGEDSVIYGCSDTSYSYSSSNLITKIAGGNGGRDGGTGGEKEVIKNYWRYFATFALFDGKNGGSGGRDGGSFSLADKINYGGIIPIDSEDNLPATRRGDYWGCGTAGTTEGYTGGGASLLSGHSDWPGYRAGYGTGGGGGDLYGGNAGLIILQTTDTD